MWSGEVAVTHIPKKVDNFRKWWFLVDAGVESQLLQILEGPSVKRACSASEPLSRPLEGLLSRFCDAREAGLTGQMVAKDFVKRQITPLQRHSQPMRM